MELTSRIPVVRYDRRSKQEALDIVLEEYTLTLMVNGVPLTTLSCIPRDLEELAIGYLCTEGLVRTREDLQSVQIDRERGLADLIIRESLMEGAAQLTTDSGDTIPFPAAAEKLRPLMPIPWTSESIMDNAARLLQNSRLFQDTGNIHRVMLFRGDEALYLSEDLGRYNALDKTIGKALKEAVSFRDTAVYTSGRIPFSLVVKVIRCGIPMLVSRSAPTRQAVELAEKYNLTLVGFAGPNRMNLYTNLEGNWHLRTE